MCKCIYMDVCMYCRNALRSLNGRLILTACGDYCYFQHAGVELNESILDTGFPSSLFFYFYWLYHCHLMMQLVTMLNDVIYRIKKKVFLSVNINNVISIITLLI